MIKAKDLVKYILSITIICTFLVLGLAYYNTVLRDKLAASTCSTIEEIRQQQSLAFTSQIQAEKTELAVMATLFSEYGNLESIPLQVLQSLVQITPFEYLTLVDKNYEGVNNKGEKSNFQDREYLQRAFQGETVLSEPLQGKYNDKTIIALATPIYQGTEIIGVLIGSFDINELDKFFFSSFHNMGYAYIVNPDGHIIARTTNSYTITKGDNLFDTYENARFSQYDSFREIKEHVAKGFSGFGMYEVQNQNRMVSYGPVGLNHWYIFSIVPNDIINQEGNEILLDSTILTLVVVFFCGILVFIIYSIQKKHMQRLADIAYVDTLTGMPTLAKFKTQGQHILDDNKENSFYIVKLDIENFKLLNQIVGFAEGDIILRQLGKALESEFSCEKSLVAHGSVDEFIFLTPYISMEDIAEKRKNYINKFKELMGEDFAYPIVFPTGEYILDRQVEPEGEIFAILEKVNFAHRYSKHHNKGVCVYNSDLTKEAFRQKEIEKQMEYALLTEQFKVYLQPKYLLKTETIGGAEALIRWHHQDTQVMYPGSFIPLFENNGFITKLDMYIFEKVCLLISQWIHENITPVCVSVNFSRLHLTNPLFVQSLCEIADKYNVPRQLLEIELTESIIFDHEDVLLNVLMEIHEAGFTLSMDDFGSGYSSLGLLKNLPIDVIKIDKTFFTTTQNYAREKIVLANILHMAQELHIHTVAEGVETQNHIDLLRELGCQMVQGYYYARPMPSENFTPLLVKQ